jgi:5'(3')-deoxyribonucleotidase
LQKNIANQMKKTIAIDMDGVMADTEPHFFDYYEQETGIRLTRQDIAGMTEYDAFKGKGHGMVNKPGFFRTLPLMEGAVEAVKSLMEDFEVYIVSAAMEFPLSLPEKYEWLAEHFPFINWRNIVFCGDKSIIKTDFLIDDHCKNLDYCHGKPIMFDAFHNTDLHHHQRVNSWAEVLELLEAERTKSQESGVKTVL